MASMSGISDPGVWINMWEIRDISRETTFAQYTKEQHIGQDRLEEQSLDVPGFDKIERATGSRSSRLLTREWYLSSPTSAQRKRLLAPDYHWKILERDTTLDGVKLTGYTDFRCLEDGSQPDTVKGVGRSGRWAASSVSRVLLTFILVVVMLDPMEKRKKNKRKIKEEGIESWP